MDELPHAVNPFYRFWCARSQERARLSKVPLYAAALLPLVSLLQGWFQGSFETSPFLVEELTLRTGNWAIRFLLASLCITPLRGITGWDWLITFRRPLGLLAFYYATLHLLIYVVLDFALSFDLIILDIVGAGYIIVGLTAFAAMVPLAATSTTKWIRRLGKSWKMLHRLAYLSIVTSLIHYALQLKQTNLQFVIYAVIGILALGYRLVGALTTPGSRR